MTILEQRFLESVPTALRDIVAELRKLNERLDKLMPKKEEENV